MYKYAILLIVFSLPVFADDHTLPFNVEPIATFNEPWAMTFLPDGRMLVTEKRGQLIVVTQDGEKPNSIRNTGSKTM